MTLAGPRQLAQVCEGCSVAGLPVALPGGSGVSPHLHPQRLWGPARPLGVLLCPASRRWVLCLRLLGGPGLGWRLTEPFPRDPSLPSPPAQACCTPQLSPSCEAVPSSQDVVVNRLPCAGFGIVNNYRCLFLGNTVFCRCFSAGGAPGGPFSSCLRIPHPNCWDVPSPGKNSHSEWGICWVHQSQGVEAVLHLTLCEPDFPSLEEILVPLQSQICLFCSLWLF